MPYYARKWDKNVIISVPDSADAVKSRATDSIDFSPVEKTINFLVKYMIF